MKYDTFNLVIFGFSLISFVGYWFFKNDLFLVLASIFCIWFFINGIERFIRNKSKSKPIVMVKE